MDCFMLMENKEISRMQCEWDNRSTDSFEPLNVFIL